jgi:sulfate permease, SulP family
MEESTSAQRTGIEKFSNALIQEKSEVRCGSLSCEFSVMSVTKVINQKADGRLWQAFFQGLRPFNSSHIPSELIPGITLAALGIPEVMGYTKIIGTPVITGIYTMLLPMLVFALCGSSRHLVVSADSATAAIIAAGFILLSLEPNTPRYVALTGLVALASAGMLLLARILRLGFLADFLSRTVLVGFLSGVGIQVALGDLHGVLGFEKNGHGFLQQMWFTASHLSETNGMCLSIALVVMAVIVGFEIWEPRIPGALLAVIGMTVASAFFHWSDKGIKVVGTVPGGFPPLGLPDVTWHDVISVLPIAFSCFVVILAQSAATSRAYALRYHDRFNQNVDLVGLALANVAAGFSGTFVVNGSPTKTAMVDTAGGRSQWSHLGTVAVVLLVLLFLTKPLSFLPNAVLSAIVFLIGLKLVDYRGLAEIRRRKPGEFSVALATAAVVVFVGVEEGIFLAVILSLLQHIRRNYRPYTAVILHDDADHWRMEDAAPGRMLEPGMVMFWFGAGLFYANVPYFTEQARKLVDESPTPVRWFVIDCSAITNLDFSAGKALAELQQDLAGMGVVLALARIQLKRHGDLEQLGLVKRIGSHRIFNSRKDCVDAYRSEYALSTRQDNEITPGSEKKL